MLIVKCTSQDILTLAILNKPYVNRAARNQKVNLRAARIRIVETA